jgi:N-acetylglucosaminyl-diphospho-decaprenol L-rhamnosyltransferase
VASPRRLGPLHRESMPGDHLSEASLETVTLRVFVIHWNEPERLMATVAGLTQSEGVTIGVCVIDNASRQGVVDEISEALPDNVRLLRLPINVGFAGAANEAIAQARRTREPWFVIAAHDVLVRGSTLAELVASMDTDAKIGIVGPLLTNADGSELDDPDRINRAGGRWFASIPQPGITVEGSRGFVEREWVQGCLLLIRAACAEEIGGFWSQLFAYYDEVDFCLRARDAGWRVGVASHALAHEPGPTVSTDRYIYLLTRNSLALVRRHSGRVAFLRGAASIAFNCTRAFAGSIAPWRRPEQRELSRHYAGPRAWGVFDAVRGRLGPGREFSTSRAPR